MPPDSARTLRLAARALARHSLAHAYGHVSLRLDDGSFLVSPAQPLGAVTRSEQGVAAALDAPLPAGAQPEVRIHREIYRRRGDIGGVCRFQSPAVMALSALGRTPRTLHGLGAYFAPAPPFWPHTDLVRDDAAAEEVAGMMGDHAAIVLRGNGAVTAAGSREAAASLAFFLEDAARIELALLPATAAGIEPEIYTADEAARRAITDGALFERMWQYLCSGDPEWSPKS